MRALVHRASGRAAPVRPAGRIALDTRRMRVTVDDAPINLSPLEYCCRRYPPHHAGKP